MADPTKQKVFAGSHALDDPKTRSPRNIRARLELAQILSDGVSELDAIQRTRDYFTGYSLQEVLTERIDLIGSSTAPEAQIGNRRTLLGQVAFFKETMLAAIAAARLADDEVDPTETLATVVEDSP